MPKELCRDLVGKKCRLVRDIETKAGDKFTKGELLTISSTHRGRFHLTAELPSGVTDWVRTIRQVPRHDFELVD